MQVTEKLSKQFDLILEAVKKSDGSNFLKLRIVESINMLYHIDQAIQFIQSNVVLNSFDQTRFNEVLGMTLFTSRIEGSKYNIIYNMTLTSLMYENESLRLNLSSSEMLVTHFLAARLEFIYTNLITISNLLNFNTAKTGFRKQQVSLCASISQIILDVERIIYNALNFSINFYDPDYRM